jgi:Cu-Zn family superoxide dismutase
MKLGRLQSRFAGFTVLAAISFALVTYGCSDDSSNGAAAGQDAAPAHDGATEDATRPMGDGAPPASGDAGTDARHDPNEDTAFAIAQLQPFEDGGPSGFAEFYANPDGGAPFVNVTIVSAAADGNQGITIHQNGDCSANGNAAGGHWDDGTNQHALPSEGAHHLGDLGNVPIEGGFGTLTVADPRWGTTVDGGTSVFNHAVILHADPDQGALQQPAGASGARVSCGVIVAP